MDAKTAAHDAADVCATAAECRTTATAAHSAAGSSDSAVESHGPPRDSVAESAPEPAKSNLIGLSGEVEECQVCSFEVPPEWESAFVDTLEAVDEGDENDPFDFGGDMGESAYFP